MRYIKTYDINKYFSIFKYLQNREHSTRFFGVLLISRDFPSDNYYFLVNIFIRIF